MDAALLSLNSHFRRLNLPPEYHDSKSYIPGMTVIVGEILSMKLEFYQSQLGCIFLLIKTSFLFQNIDKRGLWINPDSEHKSNQRNCVEIRCSGKCISRYATLIVNKSSQIRSNNPIYRRNKRTRLISV